MIRAISWNIARRQSPWQELAGMDIDIALLQEATPPEEAVARRGDAGPPPMQGGASVMHIGPQESWDSHHWNSDWWKVNGRTNLFDRWPMVVKLSERVDVEWFRQIGSDRQAGEDEIAVSGIGTITAARVTPHDAAIKPFIVVSMYGRWQTSHPSTGSTWIYADASAHRIISDISQFIGYVSPRRHRIIAVGDLNLFYGYGDFGSPYWAARYRSVFDRLKTLGLEFIGPQAPNGRRPAAPSIHEPAESQNVVTYHTVRQDPATATNQLDFAFASRGFHESITVRALNGVDEWGSSDHCRILLEIKG